MFDEDDAFDGLEPVDDGCDPVAPGDDDATRALLIEGSRERLNDTGNGRRLVLYFGEDLMFVPRVGWFTWTGRVWSKDSDEITVTRRAMQLSSMIERELWHLSLSPAQTEVLDSEEGLLDRLGLLMRTTGDDGKPEDPAGIKAIEAQLASVSKLKKRLSEMRASHRRFANTSGNVGRMEAATRAAGVLLARRVEELDAGHLDLNTESGVLRFSVHVEDGRRYASFEELAHDRSFLMTKIMPVKLIEDPECPRFDAFFERIQPTEDKRRFLLRWSALGLTGLLEQCLCFYYGMGANGKSVLVDLMAKIAGDYAAMAKIESLTGTNRRGGGDATPDLLPLVGARMVRASEPDEGVRWQEGLIKELTGGEPFLARGFQKDFFEVLPRFSLTLSGNHRPDIRGTDDGIWRRLLLVDFSEQIPKEEQIPKAELDAILFAERDAIFSRHLVPALLEYLEIGLAPPESVLAATREFRDESDPYGAFLEDACVVTGDEADSVPARELVLAFHFWLMQRAEGAFKDRTVSLALKDRSRRWVSKKTGKRFTERKASTMRYDGIRFTDTFKRAWEYAPRDSSGRALTVASGSEADE